MREIDEMGVRWIEIMGLIGVRVEYKWNGVEIMDLIERNRWNGLNISEIVLE